MFITLIRFSEYVQLVALVRKWAIYKHVTFKVYFNNFYFFYSPFTIYRLLVQINAARYFRFSFIYYCCWTTPFQLSYSAILPTYPKPQLNTNTVLKCPSWPARNVTIQIIITATQLYCKFQSLRTMQIKTILICIQ